MKPIRVPGITPASGGFRAGWYRPDAPGNVVPEDGGREPPPAPVNHSSGGMESSPIPFYTKLREATARNIDERERAVGVRRFSWETDQ